MQKFETYVMRHGEFWIQTIIEQIERLEGVRVHADLTLEERWEALMRASQMEQGLAA